MNRILIISIITFLQACASNTQLPDMSSQSAEGIFKVAMQLYKTAQNEAEFNDAIRRLEMAEYKGSSAAKYQLGLINESQGDIDNAYKRFEVLAHDGHSGAQNKLGYIFHNGLLGELDFRKAFHWFSLSSEQGSPHGQYNLGVLYSNGQGVEKNTEESLRLFRLSAEGGFDLAQQALAYEYFTGKNVSQNYVLAKSWYEKSAMQGNKQAQHDLGLMYLDGVGVPLDYKLAFYWLELSTKQGHLYAQATLANMYKLGNGVAKDPERAFKLLADAASRNNDLAQYNLALMYKLGQGVIADYSAAYSLFLQVSKVEGTKESDRLVSLACYQLGLAHQYGLGQPKSIEKALAWYQKAINLGLTDVGREYALLSTQAFMDKGLTLLEESDFVSAEVQFRSLIEARAEYAQAADYLNLGVSLKGQKKEKASIEAMKKAISMEPENADFHAYLGSNLASFERWGEAVASYKKAVELAPGSELIRTSLKSALLQQKNQKELVRLKNLNNIPGDIFSVEMAQKEIDRRWNRGVQFLQREKGDKAEIIFREFIRFWPDFPGTYQYIGLALGMQGKYRESIEYLEYALEKDPNDASLYGNLGFSYEKVGRFKDAVTYYEKALSIEPSHRNTHINLQRVRKRLY